MPLLDANETGRIRQIVSVSPVPLGTPVQGVFRRSTLVAENRCALLRLRVVIVVGRIAIGTLGSIVPGLSAVVAHQILSPADPVLFFPSFSGNVRVFFSSLFLGNFGFWTAGGLLSLALFCFGSHDCTNSIY